MFPICFEYFLPRFLASRNREEFVFEFKQFVCPSNHLGRTGLEWNFNLEQIIPPLNYSKIRSNIFLSHVHTNIPLVKFIFNLWDFIASEIKTIIKFNSMLFSFDQDSIKSYRIGLLNKLIATLFSLLFFLSFFANKLSRLFSTISSNNVIDQRVT